MDDRGSFPEGVGFSFATKLVGPVWGPPKPSDGTGVLCLGINQAGLEAIRIHNRLLIQYHPYPA